MLGCLADKFGRKQVYGLEMIIVLVSTIGSALSSSAIRGVDVLTVLAFWRFALGIGMV
jgi:PHS family inorganic phosphate transporter-like MFS transporter